MQPGQGRLILRDGTDLPVGYCLLDSEGAHGCRGILIGNIRSIDQNAFLKPIQLVLGEGNALFAHVVSRSERHIRFATERGHSPVEPRDALAAVRIEREGALSRTRLRGAVK
jgi:hypothetical protein